jgi:anti-sigma factor RsiW
LRRSRLKAFERNIMKCEELLAMLNEYVDGTVDPAICKEFEQHMADCNPCQVVVDNIRRTITLYKDGQPYAMPVKFRERLHEVLREKWKEKHASGKGENG